MQITVDIPDQIAAKAVTLGISVEQYVLDVVLRDSSPAATIRGAAKFSTPAESRAWLNRLAQFSDQIPELPDEAFTRESFYQDRD